jgi:acyl-CoA thioesterase-2
LALNRVAADTFIGSHPSKNLSRIFGGQIMAQSIVAASRTLTHDLPPSALSVHLITGGNPAKDIEYRVMRLRDERRFANRRVDATQDGALLASAMISYLSGGRSLEHGVDPPEVAEPDNLVPIGELVRGYEDIFDPQVLNALQPFDVRYANDPSRVMRGKDERLPYNRVWVKAGGVVPDDPVLHTAMMVDASDTTVLDSIITTHGLAWGYDRIFAASVNHSMWFHRQVDFGDWVLYSTSSPVSTASGRRFARAGHRALFRPLRAPDRHGGAGRHREIFSQLHLGLGLSPDGGHLTGGTAGPAYLLRPGHILT